MKMLYIIILLGLLLLQFPCYGKECEASPSGMVYSIHYENGTALNITKEAATFADLNSSVMNFLRQIANRMERYVGRGILDKELIGTKYLVVTSDKPLQILTEPGLNPDVPEGWTIDTSKIVIKLQEEVLGEERIFIYSNDNSEISPWSSAAKVNTINL